MDASTNTSPNSTSADKGYHLLAQASERGLLTIRDDLYSLPWLLDAVRICRGRGGRFRLLDSGTLNRFELEWLVASGADLYTADRVGREATDLASLQKISRRSRSVLACLIQSSLQQGGESQPYSAETVLSLGWSGIDLHVSNREGERDFPSIEAVSESCLQGGGWFVYYHHGPAEHRLMTLAERRVWIHLLEAGLQETQDKGLLLELARTSHAQGRRLIVHLETGTDLILLEDLTEAGAHVVFHNALIDYRSPLRRYEQQARKKRLPLRAYYLHLKFSP